MSGPVNSLIKSPGFNSLKELGQLDKKNNPDKTPSAGNSPEEKTVILAAENRPPEKGSLQDRVDRLATRLCTTDKHFGDSKFIKDLNI